MTYRVNELVVHMSFGVGRVTGVVMRSFAEAKLQSYYEISTDRSTIWVPVEAATLLLRRPTPVNDLPRYRQILRGAPVRLTSTPRLRRQELSDRFKPGQLESLCELVRDLSALGWRKPLTEIESSYLRKARDKVVQEWATSINGTNIQANEEIDQLLRDGHQAYGQ